MKKPDSKECSFWILMDRIFEAKRLYYAGKPNLADFEYDALESSIKNIHGEERFNEWYGVGYDEKKHKIIKTKAKEHKDGFREWFNNRSSEVGKREG